MELLLTNQRRAFNAAWLLHTDYAFPNRGMLTLTQCGLFHWKTERSDERDNKRRLLIHKGVIFLFIYVLPRAGVAVWALSRAWADLRTIFLPLARSILLSGRDPDTTRHTQHAHAHRETHTVSLLILTAGTTANVSQLQFRLGQVFLSTVFCVLLCFV
jgi:hypothetical protein